MSDVIDTANRTVEINIQSALANRSKERILIPKGNCYNCDEEVVSPKLYCDADCRDDHERQTQAQTRNGRI